MRPTNIDGDKKRLLSAIGLTAFLYAACGATLALYPSWGSGSGSAEPSRREALRLTLSGADQSRADQSGNYAPTASPPARQVPAKRDDVVHEALENQESPAVTAVQGDRGDDGVSGLVASDVAANGPITAGGSLPGSGEESFRAWLDESIRTGLSYPERARRRGVEGIVILSLTVAGDGSSCVVSVTRGSGSAILDRDALSFVNSLFPSPIAPGKEFTTPLKIQYLFNKR